MISGEMMEIVGPALAAGLMIALTHAPLGIEVLRRGIIFIDLAIAQIAGLGIVAASLYLHEPGWWVIQGAALGCAFLAALFFQKMERIMPEQHEAVIGSSFVLAASLALLLLSDHPHGGEEIQHLLSGQILFVTWRDVLAHAPVYMAILAALFVWRDRIRDGILFYIIFAVAITSSVQLVGVYVVFASLIMPALAVINLTRKYLSAWLCGLLSVFAGIFVSAWTDLPAGPVVVVSFFTVSGICLLMSQKACGNANRRAG